VASVAPIAAAETIARSMDPLSAILAILVAIAILFEVARRLGVPYPSLFLLGGLGLAFVPGLPKIELDPELVLLVFLPPLLFTTAIETPIRDLRTDVVPIVRLSVGLVLFTMVIVAAVMRFVAGLDWGPAFALGAVLGPTDAIAATTVFRRLGTPRRVVTLVEGESLFNDATALVAYRTAVIAVASGTFVAANAVTGFATATIVGVAIGLTVGVLANELLRRIDDPPVEVLISLVIPFLAYLPAEQLGVSGVLAAVAAGLVIGSQFGRTLTANSRILWQTTWKMVAFVLNGFAFVLIGLELPEVLAGLGGRSTGELIALIALVGGVVVVTRIVWVFASSMLPNSPRRQIARVNPELARRLTAVVSWAGLRGAVSLAAALALPSDFPERNLILLLTFAVIVITLVGQGLTLPLVIRWLGLEDDGLEEREDAKARIHAAEAALARLEELVEEDWVREDTAERVRGAYNFRTTRFRARLDDGDDGSVELRSQDYQRLRRELLDAERLALIELRRSGAISNDVWIRVGRDLDLEDERLDI
jgi:Na+/H+ antiporter